MSRSFSSDGRFVIEYSERSSDSYMHSFTSYAWRVARCEGDVEIASFSGRWDQDAAGEAKEGTQSVRFSDDGRALLVQPFEGPDERVPLPAPTDDELRATEERVRAWQVLVASTAGTQSAHVDFGKPAQLFGRTIALKFSMSAQYGVPGRGAEWGRLMRFTVGDFTVEVPAGPRVATCNGLDLAIAVVDGQEGCRVVAREVAPAQRHPSAILAEQWQAFVDAHGPRVALGGKDKKVLGHKIRVYWAIGIFVTLLIDGVKVDARSKLDIVQHGDLRFAVEVVPPHDVMLYAVKAVDSR